MKKSYSCYIFMLFILFLFSCAKDQVQEADGSQVPVKMAPVTVRETNEEVRGFGSLSFLKKFELLSPVDGIIESLRFREGDMIARGDTAVILKNPQITLAARRAEDAYSQAMAALDLAAARLRDGEYQAEARILDIEKSLDELAQAEKSLEEERRKTRNREVLYAAGGLSDEAIREERFRLAAAETQFVLMQKELEIRRVGLREEDLIAAGIPVPAGKNDRTRALVRIATSALRAEAAAARANLEAASRERESSRLMEKELTVKSPGQGIVGARYVEEGERIKSDDRIITVLDTGSLYAIFPVPESEAPKLRKGMAALVTAGGKETYEGKVDLVSPQADNQSFTFLVRVLLTLREESPLRPGMFARVSIPLETPRKIIVIPEAALAAKKDNTGKVFTIRSNVLSERNIILGTLHGEEREIISGLAPGEVVVLAPGPALKEGVYVSAAD
ncbi:MAG: efflux RND transporter periplasmic adaptor subunit [Treponema sp.]|nr:efflux RND transporter periplasmic adaptor subunit [Treponema sp.]